MSDYVRPSLLNISQHCGYAVTLHNEHPEASVYAQAGTDEHKRWERHIRGEQQDTEIGIALATFPKGGIESEVKVELRDPITDELITAGTADIVITEES